MIIRMITGIAGADFALSPGDVTDRFDDADAVRLIQAGFALPVSDRTIERAVKAVPETRDVLDHDGDGKSGGSLKGEKSTVAKGRRKKT